MDSALTTVALPVALGIIMFGLGLSLTPADFRRVASAPKAATLSRQLILLPLVCFGWSGRSTSRRCSRPS